MGQIEELKKILKRKITYVYITKYKKSYLKSQCLLRPVGGGGISKETFNELKLLIEGFLNPVAKEKQMLSVIETILRKTYQALK